MPEPAEPLDDTLDLALGRRVSEVIAGAAATEGELRLLIERGEALCRTLAAAIRTSEAQLAALSSQPDAALAELASELRRVERLRAELAEQRLALSRLDERARSLRGAWLRTPPAK